MICKRNVEDHKKNQVLSVHQLLNNTLPGRESTIEEPTNDSLPFLGVLIERLPSVDF